MLFAFKRSKIAASIILVLTIVLIVLLCIHDKDRELYIPIVASILVLGIGITGARIIGNILASMENTRYLGYLHMELDPEKFLAAYKDVPGRIRKGSRDQRVALTYLADGYWADGQFEKALETLADEPSKDDPALYALYVSKKASYYLAMEKPDDAEEMLEKLNSVLYACQRKNPQLGANMKETMLVYKEYVKALRHHEVDRTYLEQVFEKSQYNLRRLEIAQILNLLNGYYRKGASTSSKMIAYLRREAGKTYFSHLPING